jgi:putative ABC transport system permease protein
MLEDLVYGVETLDIGTFLTAPAALVLVALAALALPALRASRIDPVRTLREE